MEMHTLSHMFMSTCQERMGTVYAILCVHALWTLDVSVTMSGGIVRVLRWLLIPILALHLLPLLWQIASMGMGRLLQCCALYCHLNTCTGLKSVARHWPLQRIRIAKLILLRQGKKSVVNIQTTCSYLDNITHTHTWFVLFTVRMSARTVTCNLFVFSA